MLISTIPVRVCSYFPGGKFYNRKVYYDKKSGTEYHVCTFPDIGYVT